MAEAENKMNRGKEMKNKEMRYLVFIVVSIVMAIMVCVTNIANSNLFGVIVSILLLSLLCTGLGYLYCKYEDRLFVAKGKVEVAQNAKGDTEKKPKSSGLGNLFKSESSVDLDKVLAKKTENGAK
jgi:hypothetical protein